MESKGELRHLAAMDAIYRIAQTQLGLVSRAQLNEHGIGRERVARLVSRGAFSRLHSKVFALPGSVDTPERDVLGKILQTGGDATASHSTAAWLWGIGGYAKDPVHLVVTRQQRSHEHLDWTVHQFTGLPKHHRTILKSVPVTSPSLTMLHLAQVVSRVRLEIAVDRAWSLRLLTGEDLHELDAELGRQGRNGIVKLRKIAEARGPGWVPPESGLETRFMKLMEGFGHYEFTRQVKLSGERWSARVDFLHERTRTVVEIQSERYHSALVDRAADAKRIARLEEAGFTVVEVWDSELFTNPAAVVDPVTRAIHDAA